MPPEPAAAPDDEERKRAHLAVQLFAFVAAVQLLAMVVGPKDQLVLFWHFALLVPAGWLARQWWRGRRPRILSIALASLWSALNAIMAVQLVRDAPVMAAEMNLPAWTIPRWFIPLFAASSVGFTAVTIVIVTGRPSRGRRIAGAALGAVFALLFLAEHLYELHV